MDATVSATRREPWNKGKLVGQKAPLKVKDIWAIRVRLQLQRRIRDLALFDLGIDSKLRGCDLVKLRVRDVSYGDRVTSRAIVPPQKTQRPVQFEITPSTRDALEAWIKCAGLKPDGYLFPSRLHASPHFGTRRYARIVDGWVEEIGLDPAAYGPLLPTRRVRRATRMVSRGRYAMKSVDGRRSCSRSTVSGLRRPRAVSLLSPSPGRDARFPPHRVRRMVRCNARLTSKMRPAKRSSIGSVKRVLNHSVSHSTCQRGNS
jgi:hypothetical protein